MANSPEMRASDADRDRVAAILREHTAQGRITMDEFNDRLESLYKSKTYGELAKLTADLPDVDLRHLPVKAAPAGKPQPKGMHTGMKAAWSAWAAASGINWVIWLIVSITAGHTIYPWPLWVMGPWGVILLVSTIFGDNKPKQG
ncbi:unnamed protein product [[Actinomadura] parvosata subsp. kistnae]|uniref:DUF1707 domain-containing protein n=3 Tax=Nonomuraea TaxID=83681 RepID=A0A1V0A9T2_9ACTN|nr:MULTISPECIES: DUF1707 domain-containing protein [unclassified Nonomuraea]AQZ66902.1 hypothetical protein BKM31_40505 [Nonomuraea sp. ATCC 55076]NJP96512.1 DUF1707 domain-containing protein [Nonomuraea sp. FMUSA5-5]SPL94947.1 unnamed protein product [Actinomadura parvosata subsp. kistnae]